jgi:hypothetical protein
LKEENCCDGRRPFFAAPALRTVALWICRTAKSHRHGWGDYQIRKPVARAKRQERNGKNTRAVRKFKRRLPIRRLSAWPTKRMLAVLVYENGQCLRAAESLA